MGDGWNSGANEGVAGLIGFEQDASTTDLANGLWGYKAGSVQIGEAVVSYNAGVIDLSEEEDGGYNVYIDQSGYSTLPFTGGDVPVGSVLIAYLSVESGAIVEYEDERCWGRVIENIVSSSDISTIVTITQAEYDALDPGPVETTLYIIVEEEEE